MGSPCHTNKYSLSVLGVSYDSIVDGEGLRNTLFLAGCPHQCLGCHNLESWNRSNGTLMDIEEVLFNLRLQENPFINITVSGGEPFVQARSLIPLLQRIKNSDKNIWIYSGFTHEQILADPVKAELLSYCDVLVDGLFILSEKDLSLDWKGSRNQRVIRLH